MTYATLVTPPPVGLTVYLEDSQNPDKGFALSLGNTRITIPAAEASKLADYINSKLAG